MQDLLISMSINKNIAKVLVTLASIFLLAHAVYPHTHHDSVVCLSESRHIEQCDNTQNHGETHSHERHSDYCHHHEKDDCVLKQIVLQGRGTDIFIPYIPQQDFIQYIYPDVELTSEVIFVNFTLLEEPDQESFYTTFIAPIKGLRAPPCC